MPSFPPTIRESVGESRPPGVFGRTKDPAQYIVERRRFQRPTLRVPPNGPIYEWPLGVEGLRISGRVGTAEHLYLGDNAPVVQIVHRDARRFMMTGMFPGITAATNMRDLIEVVTAVVPFGYWILTLPSGILPKTQQVVIEDYEFDHPEDDRNDSFTYSITMVRTGVGKKTKVTKKTASPVNPIGKKKKPKGKTTRIFVTKSGANTLRAVSKIVYGNANRWKEIYTKNQKVLSTFNIPLAQLQYKHLPYGMKLNY